METICGGLTVLEIGSGSVAASIAGVVLADAGARVMKIEPPDGDGLRVNNPSGFLVWNRGKESVVADLRTPHGQHTLRDLAAHADVVIEGFAPGTTAAWMIGSHDLREINPALIHCSITGFGPSGPYAALKAYDPLVAAKAGLWARGAWGHREGPIVFPVPWASFGAAMQSVAGIMGALLVRERTGRGRRSTPRSSPVSIRSTTSYRPSYRSWPNAARSPVLIHVRRPPPAASGCCSPPATAGSSRRRRCCRIKERHCVRWPE